MLPDLSSVSMLGMDGRSLLMLGLIVCAAGLAFGMWAYRGLRALPVHASMRAISELIYETCKTYLATQGKFLVVLELFIGTIIVVYFGMLRDMGAVRVSVILLLQHSRHPGQRWRRMVRDSGEHIRQLTQRVRQPAR